MTPAETKSDKKNFMYFHLKIVRIIFADINLIRFIKTNSIMTHSSIVMFFLFLTTCIYSQSLLTLEEALLESKKLVSQEREIDKFILQCQNSIGKYNLENHVKTDSLICDLISVCSEQPKKLYKFSISSIAGLTKTQFEMIRSFFSTRLNLNDPRSLQIISIYNLKKYKNKLNSIVNTDVIQKVKENFAKNLSLSSEIIYELNVISSLGSLGEINLEDSLITMITHLHDHTNGISNLEKRYKMQSKLVNKILPNSIGLLNSSKSIEKTLHFLLLDTQKPNSSHSMAWTEHLGFAYFNKIIIPKLQIVDSRMTFLDSFIEYRHIFINKFQENDLKWNIAMKN